MKKIFAFSFLSFFFLLGLSACGQTGPLYLPDHQTTQSSSADK